MKIFNHRRARSFPRENHPHIQLREESVLDLCHGQKSLVGYSPRDCKELDMTELLTHLCLIHGRYSPAPTVKKGSRRKPPKVQATEAYA